MFITVDGIDGAGKTTQLDRLCSGLERDGLEVVRLRDPGSTAVGEQVRNVVLRASYEISAISEMLLYMAARAQLVAECIIPAILSGKTVVCDRYLLANVVYQSVHGNLEPERIWQIGEIATQGIKPDVTILLDLPAQTAAARRGQPEDRLEKRGEEYLEKVRKAFLEQLPHSGPHTYIIDATQSVEAIATSIRNAVDACEGGSNALG